MGRRANRVLQDSFDGQGRRGAMGPSGAERVRWRMRIVLPALVVPAAAGAPDVTRDAIRIIVSSVRPGSTRSRSAGPREPNLKHAGSSFAGGSGSCGHRPEARGLCRSITDK